MLKIHLCSVLKFLVKPFLFTFYADHQHLLLMIVILYLILPDQTTEEEKAVETEENKLPLQLAIVGRPNVGKSTLLNTLLREKRVLVGPEAGLTRDSVRAQFNFDGRTIYLVNKLDYLPLLLFAAL